MFVSVAQLVGVIWSKNLSFRLEFAGGGGGGGGLVQVSSDALLCPFVIPLFHTGHESPESPRIDFLLIRGDS